MSDYYVYTTSGKWLAVLLSRYYPTDLDLQRAKAAYEKGTGQKCELKKRSVR